MSIYQRYLENQSPVPLILTPPEDITQMNIDSAGNFVCGGGSSTWRSLPVWALDPNALCQQQQQQISSSNSKNSNSNNSNSNSRRANEQKDGDGVAGWIKDMFGQ